MNKIHKTLPKLTRKKRENVQITHITIKVITEFTDMKIMIREYFKQLYANRFTNIDKIQNLYERHNLPLLTCKI